MRQFYLFLILFRLQKRSGKDNMKEQLKNLKVIKVFLLSFEIILYVYVGNIQFFLTYMWRKKTECGRQDGGKNF